MVEGINNSLVGSSNSQNNIDIDTPVDPDPDPSLVGTMGLGSPSSLWPLTSTEEDIYPATGLWDYNDPFFFDF